jgi:hypothetical protein
MALHFSPRAIQDGLIFLIDPLDVNSYSGSGTTVYDTSGNVNHVTLTNGPTHTTSNSGGFIFDGTNDYGIIDTFTNKPVYQITCSIWMKPTYTATTGTIRGGGISSSNSMYLGVIDSTDGGLTSSMHWAVSTSTGARPYNWNGNIPSNQWSYLVGTYDGFTSRAYLNGVEIWSSALVGTIPDAIYYIGTYGGTVVDGVHNFRGHISNTQIHSRALSAAEVLNYYNSQKPRYR